MRWKLQKRATAQPTICVIVAAAATAAVYIYGPIKLDSLKFLVKFAGICTQIYVSVDAFYRQVVYCRAHTLPTAATHLEKWGL